MKAIRISLVAIGLGMIAFAVVSALSSPDFRATKQITFLVAVLVLHDAVLLPLFIAVGFVVRRVVPAPYRAVVQGALIITAAVTVVALPFMLGYGRTADLPSALPRDYLGGYAIVLGAIWFTATALIVHRQLRSASRPTSRRS
jgi:hypothetical protein